MTARRLRRVLVTAGVSIAALAVAAAAGTGGGVGSNERKWCAAADDLYAVYGPAAQTNSLDSLPEAALAEMAEAGERMRDAGTPREIRDAFALSISPERHTGSLRDPLRYYRADAALFGWMLEHCDLSPGVRAYLQDAHDSLSATLAATPTTT